MTSPENEPVQIQVFRRGEWGRCEHPVPDADWDDFEAWMNGGGYQRAEGFFDFEGSPISLAVWSLAVGVELKEGQPRYLIEVEVGSSAIQTIAAETVVDVMTLLSMWAPALQMGAASAQAWERVALLSGD